MTLHDYILKHIDYTVMISITVNDTTIQYNYWNWFHKDSQLHLLNEDFSIGHILHTGSIVDNNDGSITHTSQYHPKKCILNFYFGGASN